MGEEKEAWRGVVLEGDEEDVLKLMEKRIWLRGLDTSN